MRRLVSQRGTGADSWPMKYRADVYADTHPNPDAGLPAHKLPVLVIR